MVEKDGFDAIEYPLDFSFKAVCESLDGLSIGEIESKVKACIVAVLGAKAVKKISSKVSKAGNYVSVTTVSRLNNRQQLEEVYAALSNLDIVKMTL